MKIKNAIKNYLTIYPVVYNQIFKNARSWYKFTLAPILYIWGIIFIHLMLPMLIIAIGIEYVVKYIVNKIPSFKIPNIFYKQESIKMFCDNCDQYTETIIVGDDEFFECTICKTQSKVID